jgi:alpha 1,2-mannosyltransferase
MDPLWHFIYILIPSQISLHYILSFAHEGYGNAMSISNLKHIITKSSDCKLSNPETYYGRPNVTSLLYRKANAVIVMLARNSDLSGAVSSVKQMEDRFNKRFQYPYVFLNEEPFTDEFKT